MTLRDRITKIIHETEIEPAHFDRGKRVEAVVERVDVGTAAIELGTAYPWPGLRLTEKPEGMTWADHIWDRIERYRHDVSMSSYSMEEAAERFPPALRFSVRAWMDVRKDPLMHDALLLWGHHADFRLFGCPVYVENDVPQDMQRRLTGREVDEDEVAGRIGV